MELFGGVPLFPLCAGPSGRRVSVTRFVFTMLRRSMRLEREKCYSSSIAPLHSSVSLLSLKISVYVVVVVRKNNIVVVVLRGENIAFGDKLLPDEFCAEARSVHGQ